MTTPCPDCDGVMVSALRYEKDRTVKTRCCFDCGAEWPILYRRSRSERNGAPYGAEGICQACRRLFGYPAYQKNRKYCSMACVGPSVGAGSRFGMRRAS